MQKPIHKILDPITVRGDFDTRIEAFEWDEEVQDFKYFFFDENQKLDYLYKDFLIIK